MSAPTGQPLDLASREPRRAKMLHVVGDRRKRVGEVAANRTENPDADENDERDDKPILDSGHAAFVNKNPAEALQASRSLLVRCRPNVYRMLETFQ